MRHNQTTDVKNVSDEGFVLVTALLVMLVLTLLGIAATTNTALELQIAGNEKLHKQTFYAAEAGAVLGTELLEQNLNCVTGFSSATVETDIQVNVLDFGYNTEDLAKYTGATLDATVLDNALADYIFPIAASEQSFGYVAGETQMQAGGALVMAAGYERKGKSAAAGGVSMLFDIYSRHLGKQESESIVQFGWRHLVGDESSCNY